MKTKKLGDLGIRDMDMIPPVMHKRRIKGSSGQTKLFEHEFICPVSKEVWSSKLAHDLMCIYSYCKGRWNFLHE